MTNYKITYENEIDSHKSVLDIAKEVRRDIINGDAIIFTVENLSTGERFTMDLNECDEDAVLPISE